MSEETKSTLPMNLREMLRAEAQGIAKRISAPSGDLIKVSQDKKFTFPDGKVTNGPFEAVIVDFVSANYMYDSAYSANQVESPKCFALGPSPATMTPSENSPQRQAESCAVCPNNQFGSGGGNSKACKNHRLVALLPVDADAETPIMVLRVSPGAIKHFDKYATAVTQMPSIDDNGDQQPTLLQEVVTTIGFDPGETYPSLRFGKPSKLAREQADYFAGRFLEARKRLLTEPEIQPVAVKSGLKTRPRR